MSKLFDFKYEKKEKTAKKVTGEPLEASSAEVLEPDTAGATETFFTRNVRLITFLICLAVFLAVFGPISVFRIVQYIEENQAEGEPLSVEEVIAFSMDHDRIRLSAFEDYEKEISEGDGAVLYFLTVDTDYLVMVGAVDENGYLTCFTVTDSRTDETVDVMAASFSVPALQALFGR